MKTFYIKDTKKSRTILVIISLLISLLLPILSFSLFIKADMILFGKWLIGAVLICLILVAIVILYFSIYFIYYEINEIYNWITSQQDKEIKEIKEIFNIEYKKTEKTIILLNIIQIKFIKEDEYKKE
jgi:predicted PurR-regulated permease PerM